MKSSWINTLFSRACYYLLHLYHLLDHWILLEISFVKLKMWSKRKIRVIKMYTWYVKDLDKRWRQHIIINILFWKASDEKILWSTYFISSSSYLYHWWINSVQKIISGADIKYELLIFFGRFRNFFHIFLFFLMLTLIHSL